MLSRRIFLFGGIGSVVQYFCEMEALSMIDSPENWIGPTSHINYEHPRIRSIVRQRIDSEKSDRERAVAAFEYVRDNIKFGFARGFWDVSASRVVQLKVGYCNTKSTLFLALLRASGIPARQVFVDINASVLAGLINPGTSYVDHSYVEVWLDGAWVGTDSYIVDQALFDAAQPRLIEQNRLLGYGVHQTGTKDWDGRRPAFSQFNMLDPRPISKRRWGVFEDVGDFYRTAPETHNRLNPVLRTSFGAFASSANREADALRRSLS